MNDEANPGRIDKASRRIGASPRALYDAFLDPDALVIWLPPRGMRGQIETFEPRKNGVIRMRLTYEQEDHVTPGKTSEHSDVVEGRFLELVPGKRIVQAFEFESDLPALTGVMTMTWTFVAVPGGTEVSIRCENVPTGISQEDHISGFNSTLENLAEFIRVKKPRP